MGGIFQGCLREQTTDLSRCCVTHLTEGVWTQQLSEVCDVIVLARGAEGDRKYKVVARTSSRKGRPAVPVGIEPPDTSRPSPRPYSHDFTKHSVAPPQALIPIPVAVAALPMTSAGRTDSLGCIKCVGKGIRKEGKCLVTFSE